MLSDFFSVTNIAFDVLGYQISWLELSGTIFNLAAVILAARRNILTWPIGIIGVILFGFLFYQINLYADMAEQVYYFITGVIGWYLWAARTNSKDDHNKVTITTMPLSHNLMWVGAILVSGIALGLVIANIHLWLPAQFPTPADFPILDSITTTTAFAAQYLMMRRKLESWYLYGSSSTSSLSDFIGINTSPSLLSSTLFSSSTPSTAGGTGKTTKTPRNQLCTNRKSQRRCVTK